MGGIRYFLIFLSALAFTHFANASDDLPHQRYALGCETLLKMVVNRSGSPLSLNHLLSSTADPILSLPYYRITLLESMEKKAQKIFEDRPSNFTDIFEVHLILDLVNSKSDRVGEFIDQLIIPEKNLLTEILFNFLRFYHEVSGTSYEKFNYIVSPRGRESWLWHLTDQNIETVFRLLYEKGYDGHLIEEIHEASFTTKELRHMLFRYPPEEHLRRIGLEKKRSHFMPIIEEK